MGKPEFEHLASNLTSGLAECFAKSIDLPVEWVTYFELGWSIGLGAWAIPERNIDGDIVGIQYRREDGSRWMEKRCKRGMVFAPHEFRGNKRRQHEPLIPLHQYNKAHGTSVRCPKCGKPDWCLVSRNSPDNPSTVLCGRTKAGSIKTIKDMYLHKIAVDRPADTPDLKTVMIVEGYTDAVVAAMLGFAAVGRSSALGDVDAVKKLVGGRDVVIVGERDAGIGVEGMEKVFESVQPVAQSAVKVLPPEGTKDLRTWMPSKTEMHEAIKHGDNNSKLRIFKSPDPYDIAKEWLDKQYRHEELYTLRNHRDVWYTWTGNHYQAENDPGSIRSNLYHFCYPYRTYKETSKGRTIAPIHIKRNNAQDIMDVARSFVATPDPVPRWIQENKYADNILAFKNGVLFLDTHEFNRPDPNLFSPSFIPYNYDPDAECPVWRRAIKDILQGDVEGGKLLQEWFGYCLTYDISHEKMLFIFGRKGAGKTTVLDALASMIGQEYTATLSLDLLSNTHSLEGLERKKVVILDDAHTMNKQSTHSLEVLKQISGGTPVSINPKYKSVKHNIRLMTRLTLAGNDIPKFRDDTQALKRRLMFLDFHAQFWENADISLKSKIRKERAGILNWALAGLQRLKDQGCFSYTDDSDELVEDFYAATSPLNHWVSECLAKQDGEMLTLKKAYDSWRGWAAEQKIAFGSKASFGRQFRQLFPDVKVERGRLHGSKQTIWHDVTLTEDGMGYLT